MENLKRKKKKDMVSQNTCSASEIMLMSSVNVQNSCMKEPLSRNFELVQSIEIFQKIETLLCMWLLLWPA